jgi:serine/threonine protein kinase
MAPEQLSGESSDGRSDLFSLGVILYVMVTGHSPFQGTSATTVCFKVANREPIAASALDMTLPPQLDAVISRAMAKDPNERYQRGSDFAEDLRILQQHRNVGSTTTSLTRTASTGTRSALTPAVMGTGTRSRPAELQVAAAGTAFQNFFSTARTRDLILASLVLVLLVIVAGQSKLFVAAPRVGANGEGTVPNSSPASATDPPVASHPAQSDSVRPASTSGAGSKKASVKPARASTQPVRQIVVPFSTLDLGIQHQFKDATLYVWVDDKLTLTLPLHGAAQKKLVVFNGVKGVVSETLKVPAGKRLLRFRALSTDQTVDLSKTLSAEFVGGDTKTLQISFDRRSSAMRLTWQ